MGTRVIYRIGSLPSAILYSNSSHHHEDPQEVFKALVSEFPDQQTAIVRGMLNAFYSSKSGNHREFDPMFSIDLEPDDYEIVYDLFFQDGVSGFTKNTKS